MNFIPFMIVCGLVGVGCIARSVWTKRFPETLSLAVLFALVCAGTGILMDSYTGIFVLCVGTPAAFMAGAIIGMLAPSFSRRTGIRKTDACPADVTRPGGVDGI